MNQKYSRMKIMLMAAFAVLFFAAGAAAETGMGYGSPGRMHHGSARHHGGFGGPGCGAFNNLSEVETKKLEEERTAFFEATKDLRREAYQKRLELASEMAKKDPDATRAAAIQKEISGAKAHLAQKRIDHMFRVRKINPDLGMGFWGGGSKDQGMMHHGMAGRGRGYPDCPYGGPGGGYSRGQGMMGHGGWGRDDSRQYHKGQGSVAE